MNVAEIFLALKRYGFDDTDPLLTWVNAAYHQFEDFSDWPFLHALTTIAVNAGTSQIALPSDFDSLVALRVSTATEELKYVEIREFWRDFTDWAESGTPTHFTMYGDNNVRPWPLPDANITLNIHYLKSFPDLTALDTPLLPAKYHYGIVLGAAAIALQAENEEDRSETAMNQFTAMMSGAAAKKSDKQQGHVRTVVDTWGDENG